MKLAIMQPYFFPYIGYFQLIKEVDKFIIYDDVNFIKGGWINRNRILIENQPGYINVPMMGASSFKKINEIELGYDINSVLTKIRNSYSKAPFFKTVFPLIVDIMEYKTKNLSLHLSNSLIQLSKFFELDTCFAYSSDLPKDNTLKGQDKVISICKIESATSYYNSIGGISLYSKDTFEKNSICLQFVKTHYLEYKQFGGQFVPNLSILDIMMFNEGDKIKEYLHCYDLV